MRTSTWSGLQRVAIVGRPNVGKSTLLNRMCGSRVSIVEPTAGVTRDTIAAPARIPTPSGTRWIEVIDTGGIGIVDRDDLGPFVEAQVHKAVASSELVLFVVDARDGLTPLDQEVARRLRVQAKPVILVCNKAEGARQSWQVEEFRRLGFTHGPFAISAQNAEGLEELYACVDELLPAPKQESAPAVAADDMPPAVADAGPAAVTAAEPPTQGSTVPRLDAVMKLAVVGQRNAGKSTLINRLAGEERMIVSEIPGTTRDAVDVRFEWEGKSFVAIDTPGVRRQRSIADAVEFYSDKRSYRAIRRADVVVHLLDALEPLSALDKKLARYAADHYKPVVLAANKWDLVPPKQREEFTTYVRRSLQGLRYAPLCFLSARTGEGVKGLVQRAERLFQASERRIPTGELNRIFRQAMEAPGPSSRGQRLRVLYATQASIAPPTFVLFVNDKSLATKDHLRYLQNRLRGELGFEELPIHIVLRDRRRTEEETA